MSAGEPDFSSKKSFALMNMLTQLATSIRLKLGEEGMVIWYDSVTIKVVLLKNSNYLVVFTSLREN